MRLRDALPQAFSDGYAITDFIPPVADGNPSLLLTRQE
jgi:hypothetical protein